MKQRREKMKKKAIIVGLVLSVGVFVSTIPANASKGWNGLTWNGVSHNGMGRNGASPNGIDKNGLSPTPGLDFTTISHQGLGK
jgi:hypothetical protein